MLFFFLVPMQSPRLRLRDAHVLEFDQRPVDKRRLLHRLVALQRQ